ncbi:MAG: hypothetical protein H6868_07740 [Rhodospirillales bacterium]|nr:hypothetical protein [Rhodospirillales bacterium]
MTRLVIGVFGWYIGTTALIAGLWMINFIIESGEIYPYLFALLSFGIAYIFSKFWMGLEGIGFYLSLGVFLLTSAAAYYIPVYYIFFVSWGVMNALLGIPLMLIVLLKFAD